MYTYGIGIVEGAGDRASSADSQADPFERLARQSTAQSQPEKSSQILANLAKMWVKFLENVKLYRVRKSSAVTHVSML